MYTYLLINLFSVSIPFILSFERRVKFYRQWPALFPAIFITAAIFILWDHYFTRWGIWGFNSAYLTGIEWLGLPLAEILFFFLIPYACLFIYAVVGYFDRRQILNPWVRPLSAFLIVILSAVFILFSDKLYTAITSFSLAALIGWLVFVGRVPYLGRFYLMYFISVFPFFLVNGILTNGLPWIDAGPVVWYNNSQILSIRIIGIPLEDFFYSMLMLLLNVSLLERFSGSQGQPLQ